MFKIGTKRCKYQILSIFSATKSNMNKAHGGKRTELYDQVIKRKGSEIIAISAHNEEALDFGGKEMKIGL